MCVCVCVCVCVVHIDTITTSFTDHAMVCVPVHRGGGLTDHGAVQGVPGGREWRALPVGAGAPLH